MNTLSTESIFPETILLEGNFEYLQTRFTDLKFETIARTLQVLLRDFQIYQSDF